MAELMSEAINLVAVLAVPAAAGSAGASPGLHAQAAAHVEKLHEALARGGIVGPPGFDAARTTAALDDLRTKLARWDPAAGAPGEDVATAARAVLAALGLPSF
jgi:hypothetical protein